jgi:hypothetical protein
VFGCRRISSDLVLAILATKRKQFFHLYLKKKKTLLLTAVIYFGGAGCYTAEFFIISELLVKRCI